MAAPAILKLDILTAFDGKGFDKGATALSKMGSAANTAAKAIGGGLAVGAGKAVSAASDLAESSNAVNVAFGSSAGEIQAFGKTAAESVGLSQTAFQSLATETGGLLTGLGLSTSEAADQTTMLAERAADLASVYNTDVGTAMEAINAGLRGETEQLRKLGVTLDAQMVKEKAVAMGLAETTGEVDRQSQALAASALIMEQSAAVQGDFANTSEGLANRQRILSASFENMMAQLGEALLPVMESFVGILQTAVTWMAENEAAVKLIVATLATFSAGVLTVNAGLKTYNAALTAGKAAMSAAGAAKKAFTTIVASGSKAITTATRVAKALWLALSANPVGAVIAVVTALVAIFVKAYKESETFRNFVQKLGDVLKRVLVAGIKAVTWPIRTFIRLLKDAWDAVQRLWNKLKESIPNPFSKLSGLFGRSAGAAYTLTVPRGYPARSPSRTTGPVITINTGVGDPAAIARELRRVLRHDAARMART